MDTEQRQRMSKMWQLEMDYLNRLQEQRISPEITESLERGYNTLVFMLGQATDYAKYQERDWRDAYYIADMEEFVWWLVKNNRNPVSFESIEKLVREYEGDIADQYPVDYFPTTTNELMEKYNAQK